MVVNTISKIFYPLFVVFLQFIYRTWDCFPFTSPWTALCIVYCVLCCHRHLINKCSCLRIEAIIFLVLFFFLPSFVLSFPSSYFTISYLFLFSLRISCICLNIYIYMYIYIPGPDVPGEGEHKVMDMIRSFSEKVRLCDRVLYKRII